MARPMSLAMLMNWVKTVTSRNRQRSCARDGSERRRCIISVLTDDLVFGRRILPILDKLQHPCQFRGHYDRPLRVLVCLLDQGILRVPGLRIIEVVSPTPSLGVSALRSRWRCRGNSKARLRCEDVLSEICCHLEDSRLADRSGASGTVKELLCSGVLHFDAPLAEKVAALCLFVSKKSPQNLYRPRYVISTCLRTVGRCRDFVANRAIQILERDVQSCWEARLSSSFRCRAICCSVVWLFFDFRCGIRD